MGQEEKTKTRDEKIDNFLDIMTLYHSTKEGPSRGVYMAIGDMRDGLNKLNDNIKNANDLSTKLTKALNRITFWGVVIAGAGIILAFLGLLFEVYKYFWG